MIWILLIFLMVIFSPAQSHAGLVKVPEKENNILLVYAAGPNSVVEESFGRNNVFTDHLLDLLSKPNLEIQDFIAQLREGVRNDTAGAQIPWAEWPLSTPFSFSKPGSEIRQALIIGNSSYRSPFLPSLANSTNDAQHLSEALKKQGFMVKTLYDGAYEDMSIAIRSFLNSLTKNSVGLFYFQGYGIQIDKKRNYLLPIDAKWESSIAIEKSAINLGVLIDSMSYSNNYLNIIFLDASFSIPSLDLSIGSILKRLYTRNVKVKAPKEGKIGDALDVELALSKNDTLNIEEDIRNLEDSLIKFGNNNRNEIKFTNSIKTSLNGDKLKITIVLPEEQFVDPYSTTKWKWSVTPIDSGRLVSYIAIDSIFIINGRIVSRNIDTQEIFIDVKNNFLEKVQEFLSTNWAFLTSSIIIPMFVWWWNTRRKKARRSRASAR